jgi:hypothetical protein
MANLPMLSDEDDNMAASYFAWKLCGVDFTWHSLLDSRSQSLTVHGVRGIRRRVRA